MSKTTRKGFLPCCGGLASSLLLAGCFAVEKPGVTEPETGNPEAAAVANSPFEINMGRKGIPKTGYLYGTPIQYEEIDGQAVFQQDIILSEEQMKAPGLAKEAGNARPTSYERWPNNTVYWERADGFS